MILGRRVVVTGLFAWALLSAGSMAEAQVFESLNSFTGCPQGGCTAGGDAAYPAASLVRGADGNLYGVTGMDSRFPEPVPRSLGTIFRVTPDGVRTIVHRFAQGDGCDPVGRLTVGAGGELYGVARGCGASIFRLSGNSFSIVHCFSDPNFRAVTGVTYSNGVLFGALYAGSELYGFGQLYKYVLATNSFKFMSWFTGGDVMAGDLTAGADGNVYGSMRRGTGGAPTGYVFRLLPNNSFPFPAIQVLRWFYLPEGSPNGGLLWGSDGNLYGTTAPFRTGQSFVFRLTPAGTLTPLGACDCSFNGELAQSRDGSIYGLSDGGAGPDTIFRVTASGVQTVHTFSGPDGRTASYGLTLGLDGHLYGTTVRGGTAGFDLGTFFRLRFPGVDVQANGSDGPVFLDSSSSLQISIAFEIPAGVPSTGGEAYLAVVLPNGVAYWMTATGAFSPTPAPFDTGPLQSFAAVTVVTLANVAGLPAGDYYWVGIVDADTNGTPNGTYVDYVKTVRLASRQ